MDHLGTIFGFLFLCLGPCLVVYSVVALVRTRNFIRHCVEVKGEVIRLERSKYRDQYGYSYAPVFTFSAADGEIHTVTSDVSSSPAGFSVSESVRVRYDPNDPQNAKIHSLFQTWGTVVIPGIVGLGFAAFGCWKLGLVHL